VCDHKCEQRCKLGTTGEDPVAIRSLKRFVTDRVDPTVFKPEYQDGNGHTGTKVAVVGAGPAGLTAAHHLSLMGYTVEIYEAEDHAGGMLLSGVPEYRLPRDVLSKEIEALLDKNITLACNKKLGVDFTLDQLFEQGHKAVFVALGAHKSRRLDIDGEDGDGVIPSIEFLKAWNLRKENLAKGHVGIIGGGNSAIDAARVARRQQGVESVTILYRRTREEMPAYDEEIEAALQEGIKIENLVSPTAVDSAGGKVNSVTFLRNKLGQMDASGRRRPVPIKGSETTLKLDTLIVAISESMDTFEVEGSGGIEYAKWGAIKADGSTMITAREGVFAGGDVVTGPNTVIDAIAAGKRAAIMVDRYVRGEDYIQPVELKQPRHYIKQADVPVTEKDGVARAAMPQTPPHTRQGSFNEVDLTYPEVTACREARRCLRCDLDFTPPNSEEGSLPAEGGQAS